MLNFPWQVKIVVYFARWAPAYIENSFYFCFTSCVPFQTYRYCVPILGYPVP